MIYILDIVRFFFVGVAKLFGFFPNVQLLKPGRDKNETRQHDSREKDDAGKDGGAQ